MKLKLATAQADSVLAEYDSGPISREILKAYAIASGDLNPLHLDTDAARNAGFEDVIVQGMLGMALMGRLLTDHFSMAQLLHFSARFAGVIAVGQSLRCRLRFRTRADEVLTLDLDALDTSGLAVITGTAQLTLPGEFA